MQFLKPNGPASAIHLQLPRHNRAACSSSWQESENFTAGSDFDLVVYHVTARKAEKTFLIFRWLLKSASCFSILCTASLLSWERTKLQENCQKINNSCSGSVVDGEEEEEEEEWEMLSEGKFLKLISNVVEQKDGWGIINNMWRSPINWSCIMRPAATIIVADYTFSLSHFFFLLPRTCVSNLFMPARR